MSKKNPNNGSIANRIMKSKTHLQHEAVEVEAWGETVYVRALKTREAREVGAFTSDESSQEEGSTRLLMLSMEDEHGNRIFDPNDQKQVNFLLDEPALVTVPLFNAFNKLNGINVDEAQKNLSAGPNTDSSSSSQKSSD